MPCALLLSSPLLNTYHGLNYPLFRQEECQMYCLLDAQGEVTLMTQKHNMQLVLTKALILRHFHEAAVSYKYLSTKSLCVFLIK